MIWGDKITLLTCTCDRPIAFALCEQWMSAAIPKVGQTNVRWIVCDSGRQPVRCTINQQHIRTGPPKDTGAEDFLANMRAGMAAVAALEDPGMLFFIEDDDYYSPGYLLEYFRHGLDHFSQIVIGQKEAHYYNIQTHGWRVYDNARHASLCQTAIRGPMIDRFRSYLNQPQRTPYFDIFLWGSLAEPWDRSFLPFGPPLAVGMKGLPGKTGIGEGHRQGKYRDFDQPPFPVLEHWVGSSAAAIYLGLKE